VHGFSTSGGGIVGESTSGTGARGASQGADGVRGESSGANKSGVYGVNSDSNGYGVFGRNSSSGYTGALGTGSFAGSFSGPVAASALSSSGNHPVYADANGVLTNDSSDARLKLDIEDLTAEVDIIAALSHLHGVAFTWDTSAVRASGLGAQRQIGLIAQEVEAVLPQVVATGADGYKSIDYSRLTALLIEVAKAQQARIEALERRLAAGDAR
jgi:hypothetical protein